LKGKGLKHIISYSQDLKSASLIAIFLSVCLPGLLHAQQFNQWYFGRKAAINFNASGTGPVPFVMSNSAMMADEGAASIADERGNLLFYTNGLTVYNKQHQVMLNGDNLLGNISSCQVAIVPYPGHDSLYYIFTTDALENDLTAGYNYSLVNINHDNGNGEVISKNVSLWPSCTERMAVAHHANGVDLWLITNDKNSNIFRSWLITCNGILPGHVVSVTGAVLDQYRDINAGILKVSPDGKTLCQTHFPFFDELTHPPNFVQLFDFNNSTGIISNPRSITFSDAQYNHAEFSPNSKLLYITRPSNKKIDQLNISLPTMAAILASRVSFTTPRGYFDIQIGPDEKIYVAQPSAPLAVINHPDVAGVGCDFREDQVFLAPGNSFIGLPFHINDFVNADDPLNGFSYTILDSCTGTVQFNGRTTMPATVSWAWDFGDGFTSTQQNPLHVFTPAGRAYTVRVKISSTSSCGVIYKSKLLKPSGYAVSKPEFEYVVRCDSGYVRFINKSPNLIAPFEWDFGDATTSTAVHPIHAYTSPGVYTVKLKINFGLSCLDSSVSHPVEVKAFTVNLPPDQTIIVGQSLFLSTDQPASTFDWTPGTWLSDSTIRNPVATPLDDITYKVTAANGEGCSGEDSMTIHVIQYNDVYVPNAFTPNNDGKNDVIRPFYNGALTLKNFSIFSRWGTRVFSTSQRNQGWNGEINGKLQDAGVYVWNIVLTDKAGNITEKKGSLVLIR
jgi:gliding motility-associated-like protein